MNRFELALAASAILLTGCQSAYYKTMETFGVEKRDILVDRVDEARDQQTDAKEQFQTTYEAFQALTGFDGGELEDLYNRLADEYEDSEKSAKGVSGKIDAIERVAADLFSEWEVELEEIESPSLKSQSRDLKRDTERRYETLIGSMRTAEASMAPVLTAFKDHVLFLKHNLNAQAIASLRETAVEIESEVGALIERMQSSIEEADEFIASMS